MKKKKMDLSKKLLLTKETVAALNMEEQQQLLGGATQVGACVETRQISSCIASRPAPNRPCCMIP
ncbi:class I lanthipeptide [Chitinophaga nivalis]|uniref:Class I lanthipeptide n=1 Tax=Chitinophaga nivalis TaxID=2991709 RepID=A0ABT3IJK8_9BACT|nr:class I lanthipeptide [Chitinophaga nivalis]MCW3466208.1 class I lanthipeptide [Chitinophaga nivalis]MCW3484101.1 class I lanthipeptide [Chitinophaga nivalis]